MPPMRSTCYLLVTLWWLSGLLVTGAHSNHDGTTPGGRAMCGTPDLQPNLMNRIMDIEKKKKARIQGKALPSIVTIDTYFCVVLDKFGVGNVNNSALRKQVSVLNDSFANSGSRFRFTMKNTSYAKFSDLTYNQIKKLVLDDYIDRVAFTCQRGSFEALNIFVVPNIYTIGNATFYGIAYPYFYSSRAFTDGVYILPSVLPGGGSDRIDSGIAAVHEVGHWLGLIHTFQALPPYNTDRCNPANPNDYIADTPQVNRSSDGVDGCPVNRDTCPLLPGLDPTDNFMDYGDEYDAQGKVCKTRFTPQQVSRMDDVWEFYRLQRDICALDEFKFTLKLDLGYDPTVLSWEIKYINGTILHQSITDGLGEGFSSSFAGQSLTNYHCFPRSQIYVFTMRDSSGEGISSPGYFKIFINGKLYARGGQDFTYSKSITFGANTTLRPTRKPTIKPSRKPTRKPSRKPTRRPTRKPTRRPTRKPILRPKRKLL